MANLALAKKMNTAAWIITIAVLGIVINMRNPMITQYTRVEDVAFLKMLPAFNATVNTLVAITLVAALYFVKQKNIEMHKKMIYLSFALSVTFLLTYVLYHFTTPETKFTGEGIVRIIYFFFLITHVVLAAASFPFILFTFIRAYTNQIEKRV